MYDDAACADGIITLQGHAAVRPYALVRSVYSPMADIGEWILQHIRNGCLVGGTDYTTYIRGNDSLLYRLKSTKTWAMRHFYNKQAGKTDRQLGEILKFCIHPHSPPFYSTSPITTTTTGILSIYKSSTLPSTPDYTKTHPQTSRLS